MKSLVYFITCLVFLPASKAFAQQNATYPIHQCGTMEHLSECLQKNATTANNMQAIERFTQNWIAQSASQRQVDVVTIPVVFHVVHSISNPASNISDAQLLSQLDALNRDFRRTNTDADETPAIFQSIAADVEIEFCLAQQDPYGFPTTGITRTPTSETTFWSTSASVPGIQNNGVKFDAFGGKDAWPTDQYLNIWVCNDILGGPPTEPIIVLGYAQFPGGDPATDGLVLRHSACGTLGTIWADYALGRTATHEVGHWLNLRHVWGDAQSDTDPSNDCPADDLVADTPLSAAPNFDCPVGVNSCNEGVGDLPDMYMNYMDYADDYCSNLFTEGQKNRMRSLLAPGGSRYSLSLSTACESVSTGNDDAGVSILFPTGPGICTDFIPVVQLRNHGNNDLFLVNFEYWVDEGIPQTYLWIGTIPSFNVIELELPSIPVPNDAFFHTFYVNAIDVNGASDFDLSNNTSEETFVSLPFGGAPISENFDDSVFPPAGWDIINIDGDASFEVFTEAGSSGDNSFYLNNHNNDNINHIDEFILPDVNLTEIGFPSISFNVAYAPKIGSTISDVLEVFISTNCEASYESLLTINLADMTNVGTATNDFFVPNANQWNPYTISLHAYASFPKAIIKFRHTSGDGNNVFIDDVNFSLTPIGIAPDITQQERAQIYPNPSVNIINIDVQDIGEKCTVELFNMTGEILFTQYLTDQKNTIALRNHQLANGVYFCKVSTTRYSSLHKIILLD